MHDQIAIIKELLLGVWSKKHYVILTTWLICPIAWFSIAQMPDEYESEARVYVDTQSLLRPLMRGLMVEVNPNHQIQLILKTLLSRPNLERIARMTDMDLEADSNAKFEQIIDKLKKDIKISTTGRENIFTIKTSERNPELAQNIVQSALTVFIENTLGETREDSDSAQKFLDAQIKEYENRLIAAEARLKDFKQKYHGSMPENSNNYSSQLASEQANLKEAELALLEAKTRLESAKAQLIGEEPVFGLFNSPVENNNGFSTQYDSRIVQLEEKLDGLSLRFTAQHPDVRETQRRLDELKSLRDKELQTYYTNSQENPQAFKSLNENPVYQEMKIQANQLENDVASLNVRVADYKNRIETLKQKIRSIPEVDAEFMALNRDYGIVKNRYEELLERQESAQLAQSAERTTEKIQFRVIDPPKLPIKPSGPLRDIYFVAAFILSVGLGGGIAFLVTQINPKVVSTSQLLRTTGLPIFGVVSATSNLDTLTKIKRQKHLFLASNSVLLIILMLLIGYFNSIALIQPIFKGVL